MLSSRTVVLTPLERFLNLSQPGRAWSIFQRKENDHGGRQVESKATERVDAAVAIRGSGVGRGASPSRRDRCGQQRPLRGGAARSRCRAGAPVRMLHGGLASFSGLVAGLWSEDGGDAVHRRLLDSAVRDSGRTWVRGLFGKRAAHQESARAQERRPREPVVAEAAHLRTTQQLVPTDGRNPRGADLLAATGRACTRGVHLHPADAEGADADERAVGECDQRSERVNRTNDCARDSGWGARSEETSGVEPSYNNSAVLPEFGHRVAGSQVGRVGLATIAPDYL